MNALAEFGRVEDRVSGEDFREPPHVAAVNNVAVEAE
jgi:hypothetical protein